MSFPSLLELLIPNWSPYTLYGVILVAIGLFIGVISFVVFSKIDFLRDILNKVSLFAMIAGAIMVVGISILEDLFKGIFSELQDPIILSVVFAVIILVMTAFFLFKKDKKGDG